MKMKNVINCCLEKDRNEWRQETLKLRRALRYIMGLKEIESAKKIANEALEATWKEE